MDETATRRKLIDPKLYEVGWESVPQSEILTEQRAYLIAPGRVQRLQASRHPKKADYVLKYRGLKLAVIEAKSDEKDVSEGVDQAKQYAEALEIRFTYACNGKKIWAIDMGVKDANGEYIIPSHEGFVDKFPSPQELWAMNFPEEHKWRDTFNLCPFNRDGGRSPRYYQENAINDVLNAVANEQRRILLTMATGTGKTYTAFQICWKLYQTGWNKNDTPNRKPRILFITDRNTLADQARNDFDNFPEDAMVRVTPNLLHDKKHANKVPTSRNIYFSIFQTFMARDKEGAAFYMQYPRDFFDFIIIDECHRGGANDESQWRELMDYFEDAYQLGMTATPRRQENANTYNYFGKPVYTYSLKQGIDDGFLVPFRVCVSESNIDDYTYNPEDDIEGEIDTTKTYTEKDFYNGNIKIRARDEHRVKELLGRINPDEKTIVFCATQQHAAIIRDMINQHKRRPDSNYCVRVTADDGKDGDDLLKLFQNNDRLRPTILTSSQKLSTGVDARNVRNIVLMRPIESMIEFKQIIGRGTRLFDGKYYFTIYDFVGANEKFQDVEWQGDPLCNTCGNWPCTCNKKPGGHGGGGGLPPKTPEPCPICGNLPCTCPGRGGVGKKTVVVELSKGRELRLETAWTELVQYGDELITVGEFIKRILGHFPAFFGSETELLERWENPDTRKSLLETLEENGYQEDKLEMLRQVLQMEECDLLDVLEYLAFETPKTERKARVQNVRKHWLKHRTKEQQAFFGTILDYYERNGYKELEADKLSSYIRIVYNSPVDAIKKMGLKIPEIRTLYFDLQHHLYNPPIVNVKGNITINGNATIQNYYES